MQAAYDPLIDPMLDDDEAQSNAGVWVKRAVIALVLIFVLFCIGYGIKKFMSGGAPHKKQITTIKLLPDTPPPPPPPPPKEPPKEQLKEQPKEIKMEQPKPVETPPAEQLKMEGAAGDGPSAFAAGAVNNEYKGGEAKTIGSDGGAKFSWFAGVVKSHIQDTLEKDKKLKNAEYKLIVSIWLKPNGEVERLELSRSDADSETEEAIKVALQNMPAMRESPPQDLPQPIRLRINARKMG